MPPKKENDKGTRLPDDWQPSHELIEWAQQERPDLAYRLKGIVEHFRDYWHSIPGAKGRKLNWDATFRNWVRNQRGQYGGGFNHPNAPGGGVVL